MCGIAGIIDFNNPPSESLLRDMIGFLGHRGPDAFGLYRDDQAGLVHARLSIIDLSGGDQPIHNEDQTLWIIYNGEVFNYPELREDLVKKGHLFYTRTDTEIILHLFEEEGPECLKKLNGQFAIAIWDTVNKRLFLARDRMGIRPLFYHQSGSRLIFGSEIKALFADDSLSRLLNRSALSDTFTCWSPLGAETAFKGVYQLPPAHFAVFDKKGLDIRPYWKIPFSSAPYEDRPLSNWVEELEELLVDAVRIRLRADVPVGAYLSGGLDSTYVTSLVKKRFNNELRTFSVSFADERFNEAEFQDRAVGAIGTNHSSIHSTEKDIGESFPAVVWHTEVPLLRTAPGPLYRLSQLVRENRFKVVLTGEGSDEIFGGYDIFKEDRIRRFLGPATPIRRSGRNCSGACTRIFFPRDGSRSLSFMKGFFGKI